MSLNPASDALTARLRANWQRRQREAFLDRIDASLASLLSAAPFITDPDCVQFTRYFVISPDGAASGDGRIKPASYSFFDTGCRSRVIEKLREVRQFAGSQNGVVAFESDLPCFRVSMRDVVPHLVGLFEATPEGFLALSDDMVSGVVVSTYSGYHDNEREAAEVIYEVATW